MSKIIELHAKEAQTVEEALAVAARMGFKCVSILGFSESGRFMSLSSSMTTAEAHWLTALEQEMLINQSRDFEEDENA